MGGNGTTAKIGKFDNRIRLIPQSSRPSRELLCAESGPRVLHKALWGRAGKIGFFLPN